MKKMFALVLIVAFAAAATTLVEKDDFKFSIQFSENEQNSTDTDVQVRLKVNSTSQPLTNSYYVTVACINVANNTYRLSTTSITLNGFGVEWQCSATCTSLAAVHTSYKFYGSADWGLTTANVASANTAVLLNTRT
eukprot:CAMPEP_0196997616 /NCGR_PEP_ID=MMETSP1380-20130617/3170_1 /TAXON_ID=5936 /ORGANISM="Euplotes crassus, Strain CT5" /LENGTH=135 /DNA_ID=CAMNT_0042413887 /DNA_START=17 /DNA_END=424 /DNA_ORIENTATION=-